MRKVFFKLWNFGALDSLALSCECLKIKRRVHSAHSYDFVAIAISLEYRDVYIYIYIVDHDLEESPKITQTLAVVHFWFIVRERRHAVRLFVVTSLQTCVFFLLVKQRSAKFNLALRNTYYIYTASIYLIMWLVVRRQERGRGDCVKYSIRNGNTHTHS